MEGGGLAGRCRRGEFGGWGCWDVDGLRMKERGMGWEMANL